MLESLDKYIVVHVRALFLLSFLIAAPLISGCSAARLSDEAWQDQGLNVVFPHPPERARVKLLKLISGPQYAVESSRSATSRFFEFITGTQETNIDFYTPQCIAADGNGLIYITDPSVGLIHKYDLAAKEVTYIFQAGEKRLGSPVGVALDAGGNLYVTDSLLAAVFKFDPDGKLLAELDGKGKLQRPAGIAVTSKGDKVVADILANKVFIFDKNDLLKGELPGGDFTESLNRPTYVAVDKQDNVYVTDTMNFTVRVFDAAGRYVRSQGQIGDTPGSFARPKGVALDSDQNLYVMDSIFGNFQIFDQQGRLLLYAAQEGALPGEFMLPSGIFIDKNDRIYIADTFNHRIQVFQYLKEKVQQ
jgi:hypothetical protein